MRFDGDFLLTEPVGWWEPQVQPRGELYLRQAVDVDLRDRDSIAQLILDTGAWVLPAGRAADLSTVSQLSLDTLVGPGWRQTPAMHHVPVLTKGTDEPAPWFWRMHLHEVALRVRIVRSLGRHLVAHREGDYLAPIWGYSGGHDDEASAWWEFSGHVEAALARFRPRVIVEKANVAQPVIGNVPATAYQVAVLQVFNDLVGEVDFLTCPKCGRVFARQDGGDARGYSHRAGVTYCSKACGTAARVAKLRAKKRFEAAQQAEGTP